MMLHPFRNRGLIVFRPTRVLFSKARILPMDAEHPARDSSTPSSLNVPGFAHFWRFRHILFPTKDDDNCISPIVFYNFIGATASPW